MNNNIDLLEFFNLSRQIFGVCPNTKTIFRLSDGHVYTKTKPMKDWMQIFDNKSSVLEDKEAKLEEERSKIKVKARIAGRKEADKIVRKIDKIFTPNKLNPDDSKVIFNPVDFVVFNGLKDDNMKNVLFYDEKKTDNNERELQRSLEKTIEKGNYEWVTIRIDNDGNIKCE